MKILRQHKYTFVLIKFTRLFLHRFVRDLYLPPWWLYFSDGLHGISFAKDLVSGHVTVVLITSLQKQQVNSQAFFFISFCVETFAPWREITKAFLTELSTKIQPVSLEPRPAAFLRQRIVHELHLYPKCNSWTKCFIYKIYD